MRPIAPSVLSPGDLQHLVGIFDRVVEILEDGNRTERDQQAQDGRQERVQGGPGKTGDVGGMAGSTVVIWLAAPVDEYERRVAYVARRLASRSESDARLRFLRRA